MTNTNLEYTNNCTSKDPSIKLLKFADDTTHIGLICENEKTIQIWDRPYENLVHPNLYLNTPKHRSWFLISGSNIPTTFPNHTKGVECIIHSSEKSGWCTKVCQIPDYGFQSPDCKSIRRVSSPTHPFLAITYLSSTSEQLKPRQHSKSLFSKAVFLLNNL